MGININNDLRRVDRYKYVRVCVCVCVRVSMGLCKGKKIAYARRTANSYEPVVSVEGR